MQQDEFIRRGRDEKGRERNFFFPFFPVFFASSSPFLVGNFFLPKHLYTYKKTLGYIESKNNMRDDSRVTTILDFFRLRVFVVDRVGGGK